MTAVWNDDVLESYTAHRSNGPVGAVEPFLRDLAGRGFNPKHILDVGANVGNWSKSASLVFPAAKISMVEPQHSLTDSLNELCQELPQARLFPVAAGAEASRRDLFLRAEDPSSTFCDVGEYGEPLGVQSTEIIPLDSLLDLPDFPGPDLVKIDVEGFEMEVFKGAQKIISTAEMLVVEVSFFKWYPMTPRFVDVITYLDERGLDVYDFCWFLRRPLDGALGISDVCFVRRDSPLRANHRWAAAE